MASNLLFARFAMHTPTSGKEPDCVILGYPGSLISPPEDQTDLSFVLEASHRNLEQMGTSEGYSFDENVPELWAA